MKAVFPSPPIIPDQPKSMTKVTGIHYNDILLAIRGTDGETQFNTEKINPDTKGENNVSAKEMTAHLSMDVQTYEEWTLISKRNGKGGTKQAFKGPKQPKAWPKVGKTKQSNKEIGSQLI
jgi:hypothetical protein